MDGTGVKWWQQVCDVRAGAGAGQAGDHRWSGMRPGQGDRLNHGVSLLPTLEALLVACVLGEGRRGRQEPLCTAPV